MVLQMIIDDMLVLKLHVSRLFLQAVVLKIDMSKTS